MRVDTIAGALLWTAHEPLQRFLLLRGVDPRDLVRMGYLFTLLVLGPPRTFPSPLTCASALCYATVHAHFASCGFEVVAWVYALSRVVHTVCDVTLVHVRPTWRKALGVACAGIYCAVFDL